MTKEELLETAKPILFNTDMVKAILEGRKTVTRRVVKPQPNEMIKRCENCDPINCCDSFDIDRLNETVFKRDGARCYEHYRIGDILYVRETYYRTYHHQYGKNFYRADGAEIQMPTIYGDTVTYGKADGLKWRPSIHMPKSAARIFLKVTDVRVERLQDITEKQAIAEGFVPATCSCSNRGFMGGCTDCMNTGILEPAMVDFVYMWNSTIKKQDLAKYGWDANPWVWVYEFERIDVNV